MGNNLEVFTKKGELRKNPPKRLICERCGEKQTKTGQIKLPGVTFMCCKCCGGGKLSANPSFKEWMAERDKEIEEMRKKSKVTFENFKY